MPVPDAPRSLRADAERNRRLILETARHAFGERGLGVRLDEIAEEAGLGVGTVYRRFKDKDELVRELFVEAVEQVVGLADRILAGDDDGRGLRQFFQEALSQMAENRGLQQILTGQPEVSGDLTLIGRERIRPRVAALAANAHRAGRLRADLIDDDLPVVQVMLTAAINAASVVRPDLWKRYATLVLDALEPHPGDSELPGPPPDPDEVLLIVREWRPAPRRPAARG